MPIDRSKPLPIHEFPGLISEVARLGELAKKEASATYTQAGDEFGYECAVLNAAPALLDVLGEIRAGDAEKMEYCIRWLETTNINRTCIDMLHRYRDMAVKMEANR